MSVNETRETLLPSLIMTIKVDGVDYEVLGATDLSSDKEVWIWTDLMQPFWDGTTAFASQTVGKAAKKMAPVFIFKVKARRGTFSVATEINKFWDYIRTSKSEMINKKKLVQVEEVLQKYIDGNRDMIKPHVTNKAPQNYGALGMGVISSSNGAAAGASINASQAMEIESDPMDRLALARPDRFVPYECSSFCKESAFYIKGGCPTCNAYWQPLGFRDNKVKKVTSKGIEKVVKSSDIEPAVLTKHYAEVQKNNPTWKTEDGIPVPPSALDVASLDKKTAMKRERDKEKEIPYENDLKAYPRAPPLSKTVLRPPFQCSDMCMTGQFRGTRGCPTCNEFWDGIGFRNPERETTDRIKEGFLQDEDGRPYETYYWSKKYEEKIWMRHYEEMNRRYPLWPKAENDVVKVPTELITQNIKRVLMLTKEPYHSQYLGKFSSQFSWPQPRVKSFLGKNVLAYWGAEDAWVPGQIIGSCAVRRKYRIRFFDFGVLPGPIVWKSRLFIKLVVWAPSHSPGTTRDHCLVGKNVMAQEHGKGWKPGRIADPEDISPDSIRIAAIHELAKDHSKYYVVFDAADHKPGDPLSTCPALHKSLFPYQFCVVLDEQLPPTTGTPHVYAEPGYVSVDDVVNSWVVALDTRPISDEEKRWHPARVTHLFVDTFDILAEFEGECEAVRIERGNYHPVKRPPVPSMGDGFDTGLVYWAAFAPRKYDDTGLETWYKCYVSGFCASKYRVRFDDIEGAPEVPDKHSNERIVLASKVWLFHKPSFDEETEHAAGAVDAAGVVDEQAEDANAIVMEVDKLADAAGQVDLNPI